MNKRYDLAIYIGRFQPLHVAHEKTIRQGFELANDVLVLIGSANSPRTIKNPLTFDERRDMIINSVPWSMDIDGQDLIVRGINDYAYDDNAWITNVGNTVNDVISEYSVTPSNIVIIGNNKDSSSFYLNYFPQWAFVEEPLYPPHGDSIDATKIRQLLFNNDIEFIKGVVPEPVYSFLVNNFILSEHFHILQKEWNYVREYKEAWASAPYAPTFVTVDAVVIQSGHVLLIKRGEFPGNGLWAMPGGFIDPGERIRAAVTRELYEETKLKVPPKVLDRAIDAAEVFDEPNRSTRGRTITHAFRITLDPTQPLPKVKGSDDAKHAEWIPLSKFNDMESVMYEDHFHIIKQMLSIPANGK